MGYYEHMRPLRRGRPTWLSQSHFNSVAAAARSICDRTGVQCWLDELGRRVFFGRRHPVKGFVAGLFEHPLFRKDGTPVTFGPVDGQIDPSHVVMMIEHANAPRRIKQQWEAHAKWIENHERDQAMGRSANDPDRLREIERTVARNLERRSMGRHYRPIVLVP